MLLRGNAKDWFGNLAATDKDTFPKVKEAFQKRFTLSESLKQLKMPDLFLNKQTINQTAEAFIESMLKLARAVEVTDEKILMAAIVNGLRLNIKNFVIQKSPSTIVDLTNAARLADQTLRSDDDSVLQQLVGQVAALTSRLSVQSVQDKRSTSRSASGPRNRSSTPTVRFDERPRHRSPSPAPRYPPAGNDDRPARPSARFDNYSRSSYPRPMYRNNDTRFNRRQPVRDRQQPTIDRYQEPMNRRFTPSGNMGRSRPMAGTRTVTCFKCGGLGHRQFENVCPMFGSENRTGNRQ